MNEETKKAFEWLMDRWPDRNELIRAYPLNMVIFIAQMCAEYHEAAQKIPEGA